MSALLIIFAKKPIPGQVKTRLTPHLSPEAAARLYQAFLMDILEESARLSQFRLALAYSPESAEDWFRKLASGGAWLFPQAGADLGERLARAFDGAFQAGYGPVLLRGSDTPDLPGNIIQEGGEVLESGQEQVVLGPTPDGGYYLVGLQEPQPALFQGLTWSTSRVLAETLARCESLSLKVHLLPSWPDIDTYADLLHFLAWPHTKPAPGWRTDQLARNRLVAGKPHD
ncbi:MAG: glycosyltransferase [Deltaproteobacteria bacterium]|nr:glycosyltransferase [Deltaproteobacteria bacterium]